MIPVMIAAPRRGRPTGLRVGWVRLFALLIGSLGLLAALFFSVWGSIVAVEVDILQGASVAEARAASRLGYPTRAALAGVHAELLALRTRDAAWADPTRHVRIDRDASTLALVEDQFVLRSVPVVIGQRLSLASVGAIGAWERPLPVSPGVRVVRGRVGRGIFYQPGIIEELERPWPDGAPIPGDLSGAVVLSDGTLVYSEGNSPWLVPDARVGTIALTDKDLFVLISAVEEGMSVYVW